MINKSHHDASNYQGMKRGEEKALARHHPRPPHRVIRADGAWKIIYRDRDVERFNMAGEPFEIGRGASWNERLAA